MAGRKSFAAPTSQDFTVKDDKGVVGHLRVKPNAIAWKPRGQQTYDQITLDQLAAFTAENGKKVEK